MKFRKSIPRGFTLLELLVVMTIIALLAGGIFTAAQFALRRARTMEAQNTAVALAQAISNFKQEYGRWPVTGGEQHKSNSSFMTNLLGNDTTVNKRGINFAKDIRVAKGNPPSNGLYRTGNSGEVFDPWGNLFEIYIDHDGDGQVANPEGASAGGGNTLYLKVAVISAGLDKKMTGSNEDGVDGIKDNARSW
jgi:prepilin-type N-terminal cleavage/methylation domain-containing protein